MRHLLFLWLLLSSVSLFAGAQHFYCKSEAKPELIICQDQTGLFLQTGGEGVERLKYLDFAGVSIYTNSDRNIFVQDLGADLHLIDEHGVRYSLVCSKPSHDVCH